ncbi:unnamed protein product [Sphagnum jensenii]|uniref:Uncharacterized protein n=1 Tax=Sphagnum jensenii TaxID=128206 RepID=A0ABP1A6G6_9BRYO
MLNRMELPSDGTFVERNEIAIRRKSKGRLTKVKQTLIMTLAKHRLHYPTVQHPTTRRLVIMVALQHEFCNDGEHQRDRHYTTSCGAIAHGVTTCGVVARDVGACGVGVHNIVARDNRTCGDAVRSAVTQGVATHDIAAHYTGVHSVAAHGIANNVVAHGGEL